MKKDFLSKKVGHPCFRRKSVAKISGHNSRWLENSNYITFKDKGGELSALLKEKQL